MFIYSHLFKLNLMTLSISYREWNDMIREYLTGKDVENTKEGRRKVGEHRLRWLEDAENDLHELKVNRWRQKVNYGKEWASVTKQALMAHT
jgi:hypothetical protein